MLIKCVECNKTVSDKASVCQNCGCPVDYSIKRDQDKKIMD